MAEDEGKGPANSAGETGDQAPPDAGSATSLPPYGQSGQPLPTGVNKTDAPGANSGTNAGGPVNGEPAAVAAARALVEAFDKGREQYADEDGHLPHVLQSNFDVRRGDQIHRIPAGTVVTDVDLTDAEWDQALAQDIVREASVSQMRAHEAKLAAADAAEEEKAARRDAVGVKPKSARGTRAPRGSTLVADLTEGAAAGATAAAARQAITRANTINAPAAPADAATVAAARTAGERARGEGGGSKSTAKRGAAK
jgi:hypothetical protein